MKLYLIALFNGAIKVIVHIINTYIYTEIISKDKSKKREMVIQN